MEALTPKAFLKTAKDGGLCGGYLFFGEEEYLKGRALSGARKALFPEDDPFNHVKISGADAAWLDALEDQALSLPVFAEQKLVELHSVNYAKLSQDDLSRLKSILEEVSGERQTVMILYAEDAEFDAGTLPKRPSALYRSLCGPACPVRFAYESESGLTGWVIRHFASNGVGCSPENAARIVEFCSKDMTALSSEVDKLSFYTLEKGEKTVNGTDIAEVCCGKNIEGAFDFTDALLHGDSTAASRLLAGMKRRKEKPEIILGSVTDTLAKMFTVRCLGDEGMNDAAIAEKTGLHPYRVSMLRKAASGKSAARLEKALALCLDSDLKLKSTGINNYVLLERLVMRLCRL